MISILFAVYLYYSNVDNIEIDDVFGIYYDQLL